MPYEGLIFKSIDLVFNLRYIVCCSFTQHIHTKLNLWLPVNEATSRMHRLRVDMFDKLQPGVVMWRNTLCLYCIHQHFVFTTLEKSSQSYRHHTNTLIHTQIHKLTVSSYAFSACTMRHNELQNMEY